MVFGENRGEPLRDSPRRAFPRSLRKSGVDPGQGTDLPGDARTGRLGSSVGPGLKFDARMSFRFPRKVSLTLPANLRNAFPKRTPIGRASGSRFTRARRRDVAPARMALTMRPACRSGRPGERSFSASPVPVSHRPSAVSRQPLALSVASRPRICNLQSEMPRRALTSLRNS
jgi:hypothetical protein